MSERNPRGSGPDMEFRTAVLFVVFGLAMFFMGLWTGMQFRTPLNPATPADCIGAENKK